MFGARSLTTLLFATLLLSNSLLADPPAQPVLVDKMPSAGGEVLYNGIVLPQEWPPPLKEWPKDPQAPFYLKNPPKVIPIDVGRQLFVDDFLIESTTLKRQCYQAEYYLGNPLHIDPESEKHNTNGDSGGIWYDYTDGKIKVWYQNLKLSTSDDGIHWQIPQFDVVPGTNKVVDNPTGITAIGIDPDTKDPNHRYVFIHDVLYDPPGFCRYWYRFSGDGIHWTERHPTDGDCGDRSTAFYNPFRQVWVFSIRMGWVGERQRRYWEVKDLEKGPYWKTDDYYSAPLWVGADSADVPRHDVLDGETDQRGFDIARKAGVDCQLYDLDCTPYESLLLGRFAIWHGQPMDANGANRPKCNNVCLGFSRDGWSFSRPDRRAIFDTHDSYGEDGELRNIQPTCGGVLVMGDYLYMYTAQPGCRLSVLRRDGFCSMDAGEKMGELVTRPVKFTGKYLFVNVDDSKGSLRVAALDEAGKPIQGFAIKDCQVLSVNMTLQKVTWKGGDDLSALAGKPVRFKFELTSGQLYSFWVSPDSHSHGASRGFTGGPGFTAAMDTVGYRNYWQVAPVAKTGVSAPILWPRDGNYTGGVTVRIEVPLFNAEPNMTIRYTADGSEPTEESPAYEKPFTLTKLGETTIKARIFAKSLGLAPGLVAEGKFIIAADKKPPKIFQTLPQLDLPGGTTSYTVEVRTGKSAICRYAEKPGVAFDDMSGQFIASDHSLFETRLDLRGGTQHIKTITGIKDGDRRMLYIKARDGYGNTTSEDYVVNLFVNPDRPRPVHIHLEAEDGAIEATHAGRGQPRRHRPRGCRHQPGPKRHRQTEL